MNHHRVWLVLVQETHRRPGQIHICRAQAKVRFRPLDFEPVISYIYLINRYSIGSIVPHSQQMQEGINCPRIVQTSAESLGLHCWVVPDPDPDPGWWLVGSMVGVCFGRVCSLATIRFFGFSRTGYLCFDGQMDGCRCCRATPPAGKKVFRLTSKRVHCLPACKSRREGRQNMRVLSKITIIVSN